MKEPSLLRRRRPPSVQKIKLLCSFNGVFQPKQSSGKLRYVGGETRIISVDRNIGILRFRSKISELCPQTRSFSLKYQLPESDDIDGDAPLVLVSTDDDVRCMIDEYDKLEANGKPARLWVFVCDYNGLHAGRFGQPVAAAAQFSTSKRIILELRLKDLIPVLMVDGRIGSDPGQHLYSFSYSRVAGIAVAFGYVQLADLGKEANLLGKLTIPNVLAILWQ
ncbi:hypothetical protein HHK36_033180 [Tetracentron sinense]|uniref:PB1 domain-containing protein n=1 Tax=Tetracentron sinense TaxID=13715 RepID=A0A835CWZ8_TETSI|nr:hypothetical protein HHK36_033180 [Tetracentron sinense]